MNSFIKITFIIFITLWNNVCFPQFDEMQIDSIVSRTVKSDAPGAIILIKRQGEVLYKKAFGKSNIELNVDMNPNNVFNIGSITKEFTAICILQLVENGKLSLEDNLNKFIPNYSSSGDKIKIKHLLSQTSGIKSHTDTLWANTDARKYFDSSIDVINYYKKDTLKFEPGQKHDYSNINFLLLGFIIEEVSGMDYSEYLDQNIFKPLNMTNTIYPTEKLVISYCASGYELKDNNIVRARYHSYSQTKGTSSIHTTVEDISKWYEGLMNSKVISRQSLMQAWSPYKLNDGSNSVYGYGFYNDTKFNKTTIFHNGFIFGYSTSDMFFPEDDLLIVLASNISDIKAINTNSLVFDIAASIYRDSMPKLTEEILDTYVGTYKMNEGFGAKVFRENLQLLISVDGQPANKLFPESMTLFAVKDFPAKAEFIPGLDNENMKIVLSMGPDRFEGIKE